MKEVFLLVRPYYGVNIHTDAQGEYGTVLHSNDVFPDLPLITAATILDQSDDCEVKVIDCFTGDKILPDELIAKISSTEYDKLIIRMTTASIKSDIELVRQIKLRNSNSYVMAAGQAARALKDYLKANTDIDEVIDEPLDKYVFRYVNGRTGKINDFPTPDYSLVDYKSYRDDNGRVRLTLSAGRGCPMNCSYCPYITYYSEYESREVDKIIEDIKALIALGADVIQFRDQFFTCNKNKIKELCRRIVIEGIKIDWICETKLDSLDEELIDLMKEAGLILICFGIESGNAEILEEYHSHKGEFNKQKELVSMLKDKGIITMAFYIIGFPEDTWNTVYETYRYAETIGSHIVAFNEYTEYSLKGVEDLSPDIYCSFSNSTNVERKSNLTKDEIRYVIGLFSTMYTVGHDCLEKAYTYNYRILADYFNTIKQITECENDLYKMSDLIRKLRQQADQT